MYVNKRLLSPDFELSLPYIAMDHKRTRSGYIGGSVCVRARAASSKETVSSVPAWFRADSGTNLFKQGEIVTG